MNKDFEGIKKEAEALVKSDKYIDAFKAYLKLFLIDPENGNIQGRILFLWKRIQDGNLDFDPITAEEFWSRGVARFWNKEINEAIADFNKAIKLKPDYDYAFKSRGMSHFILGNHREAIVDLNHAISINAAGEYYDNLATIFDALEKNKEALECHHKAVKASPESPRLWYNFGVFLAENMNDAKGALEKMEKSIELWPEYEDAKVNRDYLLGVLKMQKQ